jgi:hypothetical protein
MNATELLSVAKANFEFSHEFWEPQFSRELEDLRFQVPEKQWTDDQRAARAGRSEGGIEIAPRPTYAVSKIDQPIKITLNQQRSAHLGVKLLPLSPGADDALADCVQGMYRKIERESNAQLAQDGPSTARSRPAADGIG